MRPERGGLGDVYLPLSSRCAVGLAALNCHWVSSVSSRHESAFPLVWDNLCDAEQRSNSWRAGGLSGSHVTDGTQAAPRPRRLKST